MNVSPNELRKETVATLRIVGEGIRVIEEGATPRREDQSIFQVLSREDRLIYSQLLAAKLMALNTLTRLNEPHNRR